MRLNELKDNPGATRERKRIGRGIGSGKGKTGGRGVKGQKSRTGVSINGFEGGQMPIHRRLPKRGFNNLFSKDFNEINLGRLQKAVDEKVLKEGDTITNAALVEAGILRRAKDGLRVLAKGELKAKLTIEAAGASKAAVEAIEKAGGKIDIKAPAQPKEPGKKAAKKADKE